MCTACNQDEEGSSIAILTRESRKSTENTCLKVQHVLYNHFWTTAPHAISTQHVSLRVKAKTTILGQNGEFNTGGIDGEASDEFCAYINFNSVHNTQSGYR